MKHIVTLFALALLIFAAPAHAQKKDVLGNYLVGEWNDSVKSNTTKEQKIVIGSPGGYTLQCKLTQVTDTITGYISVWGSVDDSTYVPWPSMDSVAISAATSVNKAWILNTKANGLPFRYAMLRTRCPSNTTNSTSKARLRTKLHKYE